MTAVTTVLNILCEHLGLTALENTIMPGIYYQPISRKQFLATSALMMGSAALGRAEESPPSANQSLRVALLSDTHLPADASETYRGFSPAQNLATVVTQVTTTSPQAAIINGDAARLSGERADYEALKTALQPLIAKTPTSIGLGNHDNRKHFFDIFGASVPLGQTVPGKHTLVLDTSPVRMLVLDSLLYVNHVAGLLGKDQRNWLEDYLQRSDDRPTVLFIHHTLGDNDGDLLDVDRLFQILRPHPKVKAIFYGHSHRYAVTQRQGVYLVNLPAIGYNFSDAEPVGWIEAEFTLTGVSMKLHAIGGNQADDGKTKVVEWS